MNKRNTPIPYTKIMHGFGAALVLVSGLPSIPNNPGFVFNVAVCILLLSEAIPIFPKGKYLPSSEYDGLANAYNGISRGQKIKIMFGFATIILATWSNFIDKTEATLGGLVLASGIAISVYASQMERKYLQRVLQKFGMSHKS